MENSIYTQIFTKTESFVKRYKVDFTFDKKEIEANPGTPFLHIARESGTNIVFLNKAEEYPVKGKNVPFIFGQVERMHLLKYRTEWADMLLKADGGPFKCHYFNGSILKEVKFEQLNPILKKYEAEILKTWNN